MPAITKKRSGQRVSDKALRERRQKRSSTAVAWQGKASRLGSAHRLLRVVTDSSGSIWARLYSIFGHIRDHLSGRGRRSIIRAREQYPDQSFCTALQLGHSRALFPAPAYIQRQHHGRGMIVIECQSVKRDVLEQAANVAQMAPRARHLPDFAARQMWSACHSQSVWA